MNTRYTWKRGAAWVVALFLAASLLTLMACQKGQTMSPGEGQNENQGEQPANPPTAKVELVPISYSDADKQMIRNTAKIAGVNPVYVPFKAAPDDKLDQVQSAGKIMTVKYNHMAVMQSVEEIRPLASTESEKEVRLSTGTAKWVKAGGQTLLYLKQGKTFIAIQSAESVSPETIEAIAESLAPLE
ncbi:MULTISPECIES: hypothetical protein [unclassified Paenibacillus]|uniref:hypothetical protein n=1 Tax=unclassified Paenibacillus TaxID=185978 RepID=UPI001AE857A6|nr:MULTISPECIES: hypothetical protein [unclassified Paenibacillus]MBP1156631.1 hypothetical protein [Paenibacillus sp. PvP091]MBP1172631.1 hypothetical protein [Paenibacillus sp. PvR098]MBP2439011.1 hypothetical protein [Paenibacillus sp. PvP052]